MSLYFFFCFFVSGFKYHSYTRKKETKRQTMPYHTLQYNRNENMALTILSVLFTFEVEVLGTVNILGD